MRFFQGLAAAGGVVISRSIAADQFTGSTLAKIYGIIGMINGVSTVLAPMFGGAVISVWGWKSVFIVLLLLGFLMLIGILFIRESLPITSRHKFNSHSFVSGLTQVLKNKNFVLPTILYSSTMALIFVNLSSGPFIMDKYGLSAGQISLFFGVNALAIALTSGLSSKIKDLRRGLKISTLGLVLCSVGIALSLIFEMNFWFYECSIFCLYLFIGVMCTGTTTLSMEAEKKNSGLASAIFGTAGFIAGGLVSPLVSIGNIQIATSCLFLIISSIAFFYSIKR